jgi:hypothetical protein
MARRTQQAVCLVQLARQSVVAIRLVVFGAILIALR